jgi:hypothetical protein
MSVTSYRGLVTKAGPAEIRVEVNLHVNPQAALLVVRLVTASGVEVGAASVAHPASTGKTVVVLKLCVLSCFSLISGVGGHRVCCARGCYRCTCIASHIVRLGVAPKWWRHQGDRMHGEIWRCGVAGAVGTRTAIQCCLLSIACLLCHPIMQSS